MFCGVTDRYLQLEHPFGRALEPGIMFPDCLRCARIFTAFQWADRVPLTKGGNQPPEHVKVHYMLLAITRCIELSAYSTDSSETTAIVQGLARGRITSRNSGTRTRTWEDKNLPRGKVHNFANVPHQAPKPENLRYVHMAMASIEAYLFEEMHGRNHPIAILLRCFEYAPEVTTQVFEKYDDEIMALSSKGLLTQHKVLRSLAAKMSEAVNRELGDIE
jgi:hypothetical protein